MSDHQIVRGDDVADAYAGTSVPGEFRSLTEALGSEQLAVTLIRVPLHSDFEQGTGHHHHELEELYCDRPRHADDALRERDHARGRRLGGAGGARRRRARTETRATSRWRSGRCRGSSTATTASSSTTSGRHPRRLPRSAIRQADAHAGSGPSSASRWSCTRATQCSDSSSACDLQPRRLEPQLGAGPGIAEVRQHAAHHRLVGLGQLLVGDRQRLAGRGRGSRRPRTRRGR